MSERDWLDLLLHILDSPPRSASRLAGRRIDLDVVSSDPAAARRRDRHQAEKGARVYAEGAPSLIISRSELLCAAVESGCWRSMTLEVGCALRESKRSASSLTKVRDVVAEVVRLDASLGARRAERIHAGRGDLVVGVRSG